MLMRAQPRPTRRSGGFTLVEVLVSVVIFTVGVIGMVRLQATAVKLSTDARQRAEATFLADQLLARMLISDPASAATFAHHPDGTTPCAPTGPASTNPQVTDWLTQLTATFPRVSADEQQVVVSAGAPVDVTVRLCWKNGENDPPHTLEVTNRVQWP
jgi:type IV pilus assembly protein PilV